MKIAALREVVLPTVKSRGVRVLHGVEWSVSRSGRFISGEWTPGTVE
jgi:hypothetical protein